MIMKIKALTVRNFPESRIIFSSDEILSFS
jgi:hypothetical protein